HSGLLSLTIRPTPSSTLFPYTTLFRSHVAEQHQRLGRLRRGDLAGARIDLQHGAVERRADRELLQGRAGALKVAARDIELSLDADRKSTRLNSSHQIISYAVFCLKKKR